LLPGAARILLKYSVVIYRAGIEDYMSKILSITLKKSMIGQPEKHRRVIQSLGLRKLNSTVALKDTPTVRGMIRKVSHMLAVEEKAHETK
jgi:large subunit ribosomal protein L30